MIIGLLKGGFNPSHVPGCMGWLRSDLGLPGGITTGSLLDTWGNQYGAASGCAQTTDSKKATWDTSGGLNGRPRIIFDGARGYTLDFDVSGAKTVFVVYRLTATGTLGDLYCLKHTADNTFSEFVVEINLGGYTKTSFRFDYLAAGQLVGFSPTLGTTVGHYEITTYNGGDNSSTGSYTDVLDGVAQSLSGSGIAAQVATALGSLGSRLSDTQVVTNGYIGEFYEMALYSSEIPEKYQSQLIQYSKSLYAL